MPYSSSEIRFISADTLSTPFPKGSSMITASRQYRESSTATSYSPLRTPLTKNIRVILKKGSSCSLEGKTCSGGFLVMARSAETSPEYSDGESGELRSQPAWYSRDLRDLSGRRTVQLYQQSQRECDPPICSGPEELAVQQFCGRRECQRDSLYNGWNGKSTWAEYLWIS